MAFAEILFQRSLDRAAVVVDTGSLLSSLHRRGRCDAVYSFMEGSH
jgi:hypothetical protein